MNLFGGKFGKEFCHMIQSRLPGRSIFSFQRPIQIMIKCFKISLAKYPLWISWFRVAVVWWRSHNHFFFLWPYCYHNIVTSPWFLSFYFSLSFSFPHTLFLNTLCSQSCSCHKSQVYTSYFMKELVDLSNTSVSNVTWFSFYQ